MIYLKRTIVSILIFFAFCLVFSNPVYAKGYVLGFNTGMTIPAENSVYLANPLDTWADREVGIILGTQYYKVLYPTFMIGLYLDYETLNTEGEDGGRLGFGATWLSRYPQNLKGLGFELGGTLGITFASLGTLDSQFGPDFGIFLGPVLQVHPNIRAAIHMNRFVGWYGGGDYPESVLNDRVSFKLQVYGSY
jgi:hypothetical protein